MLELGQDARLGQVGVGVPRRRGPLGARHLDGNQPAQRLVVSQVDAPETALAQELLDAVTAEVRGRHVGGA